MAFLIQQFEATQRRCCELVGVALSSYRYQPKREQEPALRAKLVELAQEKPRYGYRRLQVLLRREGIAANHKRVFRIYRAAGLSVRRRKRKRLVRMGRLEETLSAPNQQWVIDFAQDRLADGRNFRIFSVVDSFTRQCVALEVDTSFASRRVTRVLDSAIAQSGKPLSIRMDNGPELTSRHFLAWGMERRIHLVHIQPGKPTQNAKAESFHGRLRDEHLNVSWYRNLWDARSKIAAWREEYNRERPHSSLGYLTPEQFALLATAASTAGRSIAEAAGQGTLIASPLPHAPIPAHHQANCTADCHILK